MARTISSIVVLLLLCLFAEAHVRTLTSHAELDSVIAQHDLVLVHYWDPQCEDCEKVDRVFRAAAVSLQKDDLSVLLADFHSSCEKNHVCGVPYVFDVPTFRVYQGSRKDFYVYEGPRTAQGFADFMRSRTYTKGKSWTSTTRETMSYGSDLDLDHNSWVFYNAHIVNNGSAAAVKFGMPGLPYMGTSDWSSAAMFLFTISQDGKSLLVHGNELFPQTLAPVRLYAAQMKPSYYIMFEGYDTLSSYDDYNLEVIPGATVLHLDYMLEIIDDKKPSLHHQGYQVLVRINFIGTYIQSHQRKSHIGLRNPHDKLSDRIDYLLDHPLQKGMEIALDRLDANSPYYISGIGTLERQHYRAPLPTDDQRCNWWSWLCADSPYPPYYRFVWRAHFDSRGRGRIGSLRHRWLVFRRELPSSPLEWFFLFQECALRPIVDLSPWFWVPFGILATPLLVRLLRRISLCMGDFFGWIHDHVETVRKNRADDKDDDRWED